MKRHEALHPLSHHHHHALVIAQQLKKADSSSSREELRKSVIDFWEKDGADHFRDEEEVLLPLFARYASIDKDYIKQMLHQHEQFRTMVNQVSSKNDLSLKLFHQLGELIDQHVRLEERVVFPMIQQAVPEQYLYKASGEFHKDSYSGR